MTFEEALTVLVKHTKLQCNENSASYKYNWKYKHCLVPSCFAQYCTEQYGLASDVMWETLKATHFNATPSENDERILKLSFGRSEKYGDGEDCVPLTETYEVNVDFSE